MVASQIDALLTDLKPAAIKIGMIPNKDVAEAIIEELKPYLQQHPVPVVYDPVMVSTSGFCHGTILANGENIYELLTEKNIPLINHVHYSEPNLKMLRQREEHREIKRILDENGYENYISIEMRMPERSRDVLTAVEYLRSL